MRSMRCCVPCEIDQARSRATHSHGGVDVNRVYDSKARRYSEDNRTESNIVCTGKSEAEVTSNKKLCLRYCTIEANYWQIRSIARPLCDSRTTCLFNHDDSKLQGGPKKTVLEITLQRQKFQNFV